MKVFNRKIFAFMIPLALLACAKIGSPTGGPKDTNPPVVKATEPVSGSVNFQQRHFDIAFNEFVKLNNIQQNLIVSPPFSEKPKVRIKGKGIRVILPEAPKENTTYSFTFLDAISDITENNAAQSLVYAFSTGEQIDSLRVSGKIEDAFTGDKLAGVYILMYRTDNDSAFKLREPDYLTLSNSEGEFALFYLAEGNYKIYALEDANYSYSFDQPNERIAFVDELIVPRATDIFDTIDSVSRVKYLPEDVFLRVFEEIQTRQYVVENSRPDAGLLQIALAAKEDSTFSWISPDFDLKDCQIIQNQDKDTLNIYLNDSVLAYTDSLSIHFSYDTGVDTIGVEIDTLVFPLSENANKELKLNANLHSGKLHYFENMKIQVQGLLKEINQQDMQFVHLLNDSVEKPIPFELNWQKDQLDFEVVAKLLEGESYKLVIDSSAVIDVLDRCNDSIAFDFVYRKLSSYSELKVNISTENKQFFCELLKGDNVIRKMSPMTDGLVKFSYLEPGKYRIRMVMDENHNGKWDTGNLNENIQPEFVKYYPSEIELRANWQQETDWILTD